MVIKGTLGSAQTWSTGLWLAAPLVGGSFGVADQQAVSDALLGQANTWWGSMKAYQPADVHMTAVATYFYPSGSIVSTQVAESLVTSGGAGSAGDYLPLDACLVATFRTDVSGRSGRGRSYMPLTGVPLGSDHQATLTQCTNVANAYQAMLSGINALNETAHNIASLTCVVASFTKHQYNDITTVSVDSLVDVQRRRQDKVGATHVFSVAV